MPDLPGATPEMDKKMFDYVYSVLHPDQMKVYPCEVVPWTMMVILVMPEILRLGFF